MLNGYWGCIPLVLVFKAFLNTLFYSVLMPAGLMAAICLLGFSNRVLRSRFHPKRLGHSAPLLR
jgi:hypothetical protein